MNTLLTASQLQSYQQDGYLLVDNFLSAEELTHWRQAVSEAIENRNGRKMPHSDTKLGEDDGINKESDYYGKVFDQLLNLWILVFIHDSYTCIYFYYLSHKENEYIRHIVTIHLWCNFIEVLIVV